MNNIVITTYLSIVTLNVKRLNVQIRQQMVAERIKINKQTKNNKVYKRVTSELKIHTD